MPDAQGRPTSIADLASEGIIQSLVQGLLLNGGTTWEDQNPGYLANLLDELAGPITPALFSSALRVAYNSVLAGERLSSLDDNEKLPLSAIPCVNARSGQAGYYGQRILYRVTISLPQTDPDVRPPGTTVYVGSQSSLTLADVEALAADMLDELLEEDLPTSAKYELLASGNVNFTVESVSRFC